MSKKRMMQLFGLVAVVGAIAGVLAATSLGRAKASAPNQSALKQAIASTPSETIATFNYGVATKASAMRSDAVGHVVSLQRLNDLNLVCLWDQATDGSERGGGCNDASNPLNGKKFSLSTTSSTGANGVGFQSVRIIGLAAAGVASISVKMSDGSTRSVPLQTGVPTSVSGGPSTAFAYAESDSDLAAGLTPVSVVAFNSAGKQIDSSSVGLVN